MKKTILAITLALSLSNVALAGDYSVAAERETRCNGRAKFALGLYDLSKVSPDGVTDSVKPKLHKEYWISSAEAGVFDDEKVREMEIFEVNYVFDKATSQKDAFITAWTHCMDVSTAGDEYIRR